MRTWKNLGTLIMCWYLLSISLIGQALPNTFEKGTIVEDSDFTNLTSQFSNRSRANSIALIENYLVSEKSALAGRTINIDMPTDWGSPDGQWMTDRPYLQKYVGKSVSAAEMIWMISREDLGSGKYNIVNLFSDVSPLYVLALIQKESGLIYGKCANVSCYDQSVDYRLNRLTGYGCTDSLPDCNPLFLSPFLQLYLAIRDKKAYSDGCKVGFDTWNSGYLKSFNSYKVGNTITVDGQRIVLKTAIACASYIYTPHDIYDRFFRMIHEINNRLTTISNTLPPDQNQAPSIPNPTPAEAINLQPVSGNFQGIQIQQDSPILQIIQQVDVPKPPIPRVEIYVPLYVEETNVTKYPNYLADQFMQNLNTPRNLPSITPEVKGASTIRTLSWSSSLFIAAIIFLTIPIISFGIYRAYHSYYVRNH